MPAITSVLYKKVNSNPNFLYYKAIYSPNEYIEFNYNKTNDQTSLISYTVNGQNIVPILAAIDGGSAEKKQAELYLTYLKIKNGVDVGSVSGFEGGAGAAVVNFVTA